MVPTEDNIRGIKIRKEIIRQRKIIGKDIIENETNRHIF